MKMAGDGVYQCQRGLRLLSPPQLTIQGTEAEAAMRPLLVCGRGKSRRRGRMGFSRPDQATAVVIDHVWVGVQEFILERLKVVVVQTELKLKGPIGHAASPLEHGHRVIENLLEGHDHPSTTLALMPKEGDVRPGGVSMKV